VAKAWMLVSRVHAAEDAQIAQAGACLQAGADAVL